MTVSCGAARPPLRASLAIWLPFWSHLLDADPPACGPQSPTVSDGQWVSLVHCSVAMNCDVANQPL